MKTWKEYHDLYLCCDTLQLADVFEEFRKVSIETYGLDPAYYYSTPNYSWDCLLRNTRLVDGKYIIDKNLGGEPLELELLTEPDMFMMFEKCIRGGISQVGRQRKAVADLTHKLLYLDANNLYGWAMTRLLTILGFKWASEKKITRIEEHLKSGERYDLDTEVGCILEVDLHYPKKAQNKHLDLPLAPELLNIRGEWLSQDQQKHYGPDYVNSVKKLCTTFFDKERYVVYLENLQFYLDHGMVLNKVHRVITFKQAKWMEPYILFNTQMRTKAKNDFEKDFYKLMNNSVFGKTMENVRKYKNIKLIHPDNISKHWSPLLHYWEQISDSMVILHYYKDRVTMNKPVYVGAKILDLSKLLMYDFLYNYLKPKFGDRVKVLYMDTDSFVLFIESSDIEKELLPDL